MTMTIGGTSGVTLADATQATSHMGVFAAAAVGSVGSYALLRPNGTTSWSGAYIGVSPGYTTAGSGLYYSNAYGPNATVNTAPAGTWRIFGPLYSGLSGSAYNATLCFRIA